MSDLLWTPGTKGLIKFKYHFAKLKIYLKILKLNSKVDYKGIWER